MTDTIQTLPARAAQRDEGLDLETIQAVVERGDLAKLTPAERLSYYLMRCAAAGLDPRSQPFTYIALGGRLVLYANKTCADQLASTRGLTTEILSRTRTEGDIYEVVCQCRDPLGRVTTDLGAVFVGGLRGEALANAIMKCVTKARRRTILSHCGLGMMDESEAETLAPGFANDGSHARGVVDIATGEVLEAALPQAEQAKPPPAGSLRERVRAEWHPDCEGVARGPMPAPQAEEGPERRPFGRLLERVTAAAEHTPSYSAATVETPTAPAAGPAAPGPVNGDPGLIHDVARARAGRRLFAAARDAGLDTEDRGLMRAVAGAALGHEVGSIANLGEVDRRMVSEWIEMHTDEALEVQREWRGMSEELGLPVTGTPEPEPAAGELFAAPAQEGETEIPAAFR
jgi:hypothetical protein